ncbi:two component transcriptional regulator, LytTR family [Arachidicoccus rhizosphaerae]|uniref:Two component transcriptional regulator, LytTR family n=1 Tax=Arachidicoccus rhizosphaerae TaxID=551991 RepID=A0A1H3VS02_9BACT|nr:LytTR family DNA-binding domain-containing protein [Arachidicoccus rhizosphaerae]SDZ77549.1 two component transcriptional regulator, LytTR family [Arachidicoccus rhizosphaerae]
MLIKAIIIDDERPARAELKKLLQAYPEIEILDEAQNSKEAIEKIHEHNPDLIFLDIQMPGQNGFELLSELVSAPKVIFTTAFDEYALKAFEVNALDYLLKPVDSKRLAEAIQKLSAQFQSQVQQKENKTVLTENEQFFVKDGDKCWFVKLSDVRLFESAGNYAKVYFDNYKPLILKSLNALEERLDEHHFFRVNRKHIVNLKWISKIEPYFNGGLLLELKNGEKIEVSRRQSAKFKEMMSL